ncbi:hypothetical protein WJX79_000257 [Trebouxia sp. C0005]|nr:MAG: hypothetical protein FRX49_03333 [Trebouxia sp. A1-2]
MLADSGVVRDDTPPRNAPEAVQRLTQETQSLAKKLRQLIGSLQRSSSDNVSSTLQHLAVYNEAVQSLQANATAAILASDAMQQACGKLYEELAAVDSLAKEVHDLRNRVEQLEGQVSAKLRS